MRRVYFFLWRRSCVFFLSSCWVWGRLLLSLFWCDCSAFFLRHLRFSAACHAAGYPSRVPHLAASGWLTSSCSGRLAWGWVSCHRCLDTPLGFLPCASAAPPSAASPWGFCTLGGCGNLSGSSLRVYSCGGALWLGWRGICCVTWFSPMCRALPQGLQLAQLSQLQVTLGFSGHRVPILLPW